MAGVPGQGRKFDINEALDQAISHFWRHGYDGTSIAALTRRMGITTPSLYAAFGGKEQVFYAAVERYRQTTGDFVERAFDEEERALDLMRRLLYGAAVHYTDDATPGGCLIINSATCVNPESQNIADYAEKLRLTNIMRIEERVGSDVRTGHLAITVDAATLARYVSTIVQGMAQRGRDGATVDELTATADLALLTITQVCSQGYPSTDSGRGNR